MQVKKAEYYYFTAVTRLTAKATFYFSLAIKFKMELITNIRFFILVLSFAKKQNQCATEIERELNYNQNICHCTYIVAERTPGSCR